jgi:hypothetical protein
VDPERVSTPYDLRSVITGRGEEILVWAINILQRNQGTSLRVRWHFSDQQKVGVPYQHPLIYNLTVDSVIHINNETRHDSTCQ